MITFSEGKLGKLRTDDACQGKACLGVGYKGTNHTVGEVYSFKG